MDNSIKGTIPDSMNARSTSIHKDKAFFVLEMATKLPKYPTDHQGLQL